jgi:hypothetical protein
MDQMTFTAVGVAAKADLHDTSPYLRRKVNHAGSAWTS